MTFKPKFLLIASLFIGQQVLAQNTAGTQVVVFGKSPVVVHPAASLNIFSDVSQGGTLVSHPASSINFYGSVWQNEGGSRMPDESPRGLDGSGGIYTFSDEILSLPQRIISLNSQPYNGFTNLRISNSQNVTLGPGNLHVNSNLDFDRGHIILDGGDLTVGQPGGGSITGFGPTNFVVTGPDLEGYHLIRSSNSSGAIDFPIGTVLGSYTPASLLYTGNPQIFRMRVAEEVYNKRNFTEYVYKTWSLTRDFQDVSGRLELKLQHNSSDEGIEYFRNRNEGYISRYTPGLTGLWDIQPPSISTTPGSITGRTPVFNAFVHSRTDIGALQSVEYFTKSVIKKDVDANFPVNIPDAISPNGDGLNDTYIIEKRQSGDIIRFEVYSRNQVLVYQNTDYQNTFDGNGNQGGFLGNTLPDGIYYYLISVNGSKGIPGYLIINR